jgi:hypothetical protein
MSVNVKQEVTQDRIDAMIAAGRGDGATPEAPPVNAPQPDPAIVAPAETVADDFEQGQQPQADPIAEAKAKYEAELEELREELKNTKAQVSQSHRRNQESARDRQAAEQAALAAQERDQRVEAALRRMDGMAAGLAQLAKLDPSVAGQVLQTWGADAANGGGGRDQFSIHGAERRDDPRVLQLQGELEKMKRDVSGFAFNVNSGAVQATIDRMMAGNTAFKAAEELGELDEIREKVFTKFLELDKENPGSINPHSPRQINEAVKRLVDDAAKREQKRAKWEIKSYREQRKALNSQAGAPTRGPNAPVRAAPTPTGPAQGESKKAQQARWENAFTNATKATPKGPSSEV